MKIIIAILIFSVLDEIGGLEPLPAVVISIGCGEILPVRHQLFRAEEVDTCTRFTQHAQSPFGMSFASYVFSTSTTSLENHHKNDDADDRPQPFRTFTPVTPVDMNPLAASRMDMTMPHCLFPFLDLSLRITISSADIAPAPRFTARGACATVRFRHSGDRYARC